MSGPFTVLKSTVIHSTIILGLHWSNYSFSYCHYRGRDKTGDLLTGAMQTSERQTQRKVLSAVGLAGEPPSETIRGQAPVEADCILVKKTHFGARLSLSPGHGTPFSRNDWEVM